MTETKVVSWALLLHWKSYVHYYSSNSLFMYVVDSRFFWKLHSEFTSLFEFEKRLSSVSPSLKRSCSNWSSWTATIVSDVHYATYVAAPVEDCLPTRKFVRPSPCLWKVAATSLPTTFVFQTVGLIKLFAAACSRIYDNVCHNSKGFYFWANAKSFLSFYIHSNYSLKKSNQNC